MSATYSGRWSWPSQECDHKPERRVAGTDVNNHQGELMHRRPEYCRDCGRTFAPPPVEPTRDDGTHG